MKTAREPITAEPATAAAATGRADVRFDARDKATGVTRYSADLPVPGALEVVLVRSPLPHAEITGVAAAAALAVPGVVAVVTAADLPAGLAGRRVRDMPLLARGVVRFVGEPIAAVLAESRRAAESGALLVSADYRELPAVFDPQAAIAGNGPLVHEAPWEYPGAVIDAGAGPNLQSVMVGGDPARVAQALAGAASVVTAAYRTPAGHQGYLEPQAWVAFPAEHGVLRLRGTTKSPYRLRGQVAACLGLAPEVLQVDPAPLGGDFGGKGGVVDATVCVALARYAGRPVRLVLRSAEDLAATDARHPAVIRVRVGCDADGRLAGLDFDAVFDGGAYAAAKPIPSVNLHGALECALGYRLPCYAQRSRVAYTNTVPKGHMRSPGSPQTVFAIESALDELAAAAGISPVELRRRNLLETGEPDAYGHSWPQARGRETLEAAVAALSDAAGPALSGRPAAPVSGTPVPSGWAAGTGLAVYARPTPAPGPTSLSLAPRPGGRLELGVPVPETGTGSHAVARRLLASALRIDPALVDVGQVATTVLPGDPGVGASRVTVGLSRAVARLAEAWLASPQDRPVVVDLPAGAEPPALSYCVQAARVAVDPETGQVRIVELISAVDVASIVNPRAHQMQIDGGAVMGIGFACLEDLLEDEGQVWASSLGEFRLPTAGDVPALRTVLVGGGRGIGPANVKAVGELTNVPVAAAVANAVADAVGVRVRELPITAERVYWILREGPRP
jgi:CO/xanthine dehydrogenase Mo-binding subunit